MTPNPVRVSPVAPVDRCAELMHNHAVRHLPVVDTDGSVVGMLQDFVVERHAEAPGAHTLVAGEVASLVEVVAHASDDLARTLKRIWLSRQDVAVVLDEESVLAGIVTEHDVVRLAQDALPDTLLALRRPDKPVWAVGLADPAVDALRLMRRHDLRHVLVARGDQLAGVLSFRDLARHGITAGVSLHVADLITPDPICVAVEGTSMPEIARLMAVWKVGCVPLLDFADRPVGIVTRTDLVSLVIEAMRGRPRVGRA